MLSVRNLHTAYGESRILRGIDLEVRAGEVAGIIGRNGMGKTTLLKAIIGLVEAREGSIEFESKEMTRLAPEQRSRLGIAYVPQGREIFPLLSVHENLLMGLEAHPGRPARYDEGVLELFPVLRGMLNRKGGVLSGGQQQQLAIARALVGRPRMLLLDEPTEGIQPSIIIEIEDVLWKLKKQGDVSILLVEQYLDFAWRLSDRYYVMEKGQFVASGEAVGEYDSSLLAHLTL